MEKNNKPNILFIYTDQHRFDCLGVNGHAVVQTPNLDALARSGCNFTNAFTPCPMCVPVRNSLLSGKWPSRHGVVFNFDGETFKPIDDEDAGYFKNITKCGYRTGHIGRWHVHPSKTPLDFGFQEYIPDWRYSKWRAGQGLPPLPRDHVFAGQTDPHIAPHQSEEAWLADQAIDMIKRYEQDIDPFFIRFHTLHPHCPCRPPEPYASMYKPEDLEPWPSFDEDFEGKPIIQKQMLAAYGMENHSWEDWAPIVARTFGTITLLDHEIGRILSFLEERGLAENTIVIYSSDHGDMLGSHRMFDKHVTMYDDTVRVPLIARWPGVISENSECGSFVSNAVDLPYSLGAAAGLDENYMATLDGKNMFRMIEGDENHTRDDIYSMYAGNQFGGYSQRMLRNNKWKYICNFTSVDELYNIQNDPSEMNNLVKDDSCSEVKSSMRKRLYEWMQASGDRLANRATKKRLNDGVNYFDE